MIQSRCSRICGLLTFLALFVATAGGAAPAGTDAAGSKQELQRIKKEMREKKKELKRADKKEHSILSELDSIDREVQAGKTELVNHQKKLREAEAALREVEQSNAVVNRELAGLKETYARRLRVLYKMSRNGSAADLAVPVGTTDSFRRIRYLALIAQRDRRLIEDYGSALDRLAGQQAQIAEKKQALIERNRAIETEKNRLEAQKRKKAVLLASVRREKGLYEQTLRELEESSASLWALVQKTEQDRKAARSASSRTIPPRATRNEPAAFLWPVDGQVLTRFGMQRHPQFKTLVFRRGIEIGAREGEAVHAAADGQVVYADWYKGYGKLVIIEHAPGFYTLYGNLSQLDLAKGSRVLKGQVIGLAGDTGSLKGAKLYFEVRRNGEAQDPLLWLAKQ